MFFKKDLYLKELDQVAKDMTIFLSYNLPPKPVATPMILQVLEDLYNAANLEKTLFPDMPTAYHTPITWDFEWFIGRLLVHFAQKNELPWTVQVRKNISGSTKKITPDISIYDSDKLLAVLEIKVGTTFHNSFFNPQWQKEQEKRQISKLQKWLEDPVGPKPEDYDFEKHNITLREQLLKSGKYCNNNVYLIVPTLAKSYSKIDQKNYTVQDFYNHFAQFTKLQPDKLVLLSDSLSKKLNPTMNFERMLYQIMLNTAPKKQSPN